MTAAPASVAPPADVAPAGGRVLVVEDSVDHQRLMVTRLQNAGFDVRGASSAQEARSMLDGIDLVLLDFRLPGTNGIELLAELQTRENAPSVVMVTGAGSVNVAVDAMRAGAIDFVAKDHGYLDTLPEIVWRAWRHHDLTRRAAELQRLALLVTSATDRDELFHEIVSGAGRLLRATSSALLLSTGHGLEPVTVLGAPPADLDELRTTRLGGPEDVAPRVVDGRLLVPLPYDEGEPLGMLVLWGDGRLAAESERDLARAFASFAGMALRNLRQRDLERDLVAQLQQTVDARRDFVASVSHELRTPLTCIAGFTETLRRHWGELPDSRRLDLLERVGRNAVDLQGLVDELIDLATLDRGGAVTVSMADVDLSEAIRQVVTDAGEILADRQVTVEVPALSAVADPLLLRRTIGNLLTNAVKFSSSGSAIDVRAWAEHGRVRIEVRDEGVGLAPRDAARVFDPFFRASGSVANAVRGSGIGLALVKEYVRTMGGTVGVTTEPGAGSTFWFTLRASVPGQPVSSATTEPVSGQLQG